MRRNARSTSTWSALTSWYSSTQTWSISDASSGPRRSSAAAARQYRSRSSKSTRPSTRLRLHVRAADRRDRLELVGAPRRDLVDHRRQRALRVDRARVDVEQRSLLREAPAGRGGAVLVADEVDRRRRRRRRRGSRTPPGSPSAAACRRKRAVRDRVERAARRSGRAARRRAPGASGEQRLAAVHHLARGAPGEGQRHDALGGHTARDEPRDPGRQRGGLAGAGAGQDPQLVALERGRRPLLLVQPVDRGEHTFDYRPPPPLSRVCTAATTPGLYRSHCSGLFSVQTRAAGAGGCGRVQAGAGGCGRVRAGAGGCGPVQAG